MGDFDNFTKFWGRLFPDYLILRKNKNFNIFVLQAVYVKFHIRESQKGKPSGKAEPERSKPNVSPFVIHVEDIEFELT